jgi:AcrR family transcriptional regulator
MAARTVVTKEKTASYYETKDALLSGRSNQKVRTRQDLVDAARELVMQGKLPTVIEVAHAAKVSPATAYRYFPDQLRLLGEALKENGPYQRARMPVSEMDPELSPIERITLAADGFYSQAQEREKLIRAVMAISLLKTIDGTVSRKEAVSVRPGLRRLWIDKAMAPEQRTMDPAEIRRLKLALSVLISSEALVALKDINGISGPEAVEICTWACRTLVEAVVPGAKKPGVREGAKKKVPVGAA